MRFEHRTGAPAFTKAFEYVTDGIIYYPFLSSSLFTAVEKDGLTSLLRWNLLRVAVNCKDCKMATLFVQEPAGQSMALEYIQNFAIYCPVPPPLPLSSFGINPFVPPPAF